MVREGKDAVGAAAWVDEGDKWGGEEERNASDVPRRDSSGNLDVRSDAMSAVSSTEAAEQWCFFQARRCRINLVPRFRFQQHSPALMNHNFSKKLR